MPISTTNCCAADKKSTKHFSLCIATIVDYHEFQLYFELNAFEITDVRVESVNRRERQDMFDYEREVSFGFPTKSLKDQRTTINVSLRNPHFESPDRSQTSEMQGATFPSHLSSQVFVIEVL